MLEEGRAHRARTGKSLMVPRYDIVPIPQHVRENLDKQKVGMLAPNAVEMFPAETAQSMFDFRAEDVVGKIAPRPLLLIHAANDSVTPTEQSIELFKRAGQPTELHLFSGARPFSVRREFGAGLERAARLARHLFPAASDRNAATYRERENQRVSQEDLVGHEELSASSATCSKPRARSAEDAAIVADGLVWANLRGVDGHGVSRLPRYLRMHRARRDRCQGAAALDA